MDWGHAGTFPIPAGAKRYLSMNFGSWDELALGDETMSNPDVQISPSGPTISGETVSGTRIKFWCDVNGIGAGNQYTLSFTATLSGGGRVAQTATLQVD